MVSTHLRAGQSVIAGTRGSQAAARSAASHEFAGRHDETLEAIATNALRLIRKRGEDDLWRIPTGTVVDVLDGLKIHPDLHRKFSGPDADALHADLLLFINRDLRRRGLDAVSVRAEVAKRCGVEQPELNVKLERRNSPSLAFESAGIAAMMLDDLRRLPQGPFGNLTLKLPSGEERRFRKAHVLAIPDTYLDARPGDPKGGLFRSPEQVADFMTRGGSYREELLAEINLVASRMRPDRPLLKAAAILVEPLRVVFEERLRLSRGEVASIVASAVASIPEGPLTGKVSYSSGGKLQTVSSAAAFPINGNRTPKQAARLREVLVDDAASLVAPLKEAVARGRPNKKLVDLVFDGAHHKFIVRDVPSEDTKTA